MLNLVNTPPNWNVHMRSIWRLRCHMNVLCTFDLGAGSNRRSTHIQKSCRLCGNHSEAKLTVLIVRSSEKLKMQQSLVEISTTRRSVSKFTKDPFLRELFQEKTSLCLHFNQLYLNPFPNKPLPFSRKSLEVQSAMMKLIFIAKAYYLLMS